MMDYILYGAVAALVSVIGYILASKGLSVSALKSILIAVAEGVSFAEQMYKKNTDADRSALAIEKITELLTVMKIDASKYQSIISWLIEAAVNRLPKTNA